MGALMVDDIATWTPLPIAVTICGSVRCGRPRRRNASSATSHVNALPWLILASCATSHRVLAMAATPSMCTSWLVFVPNVSIKPPYPSELSCSEIWSALSIVRESPFATEKSSRVSRPLVATERLHHCQPGLDRNIHGGASEKKELDPNNRGSVVLGPVAYYMDSLRLRRAAARVASARRRNAVAAHGDAPHSCHRG
jgi:hypothetical protein